MALSSQFPLCPSKFTSPKTLSIPTAPNATKLTTKFQSKPLRFGAIAKASQEEDRNASIAKASKEEDKISGSDAESQAEKSRNEEMAEIGLEIKKAMMERGQNGEAGFFSGVAEEIREIEWPSFGKVVGTTGVVLGVIAGSSVVLLTVNAVLAELSDRVFAGKGVQDFFG